MANMHFHLYLAENIYNSFNEQFTHEELDIDIFYLGSLGPLGLNYVKRDNFKELYSRITLDSNKDVFDNLLECYAETKDINCLSYLLGYYVYLISSELVHIELEKDYQDRLFDLHKSIDFYVIENRLGKIAKKYKSRQITYYYTYKEVVHKINSVYYKVYGEKATGKYIMFGIRNMLVYYNRYRLDRTGLKYLMYRVLDRLPISDKITYKDYSYFNRRNLIKLDYNIIDNIINTTKERFISMYKDIEKGESNEDR